MKIIQRKQKQKVYARGFTLVEMMVSLVIFSIVMVISTGTLLVMIDINAKAQALYTSMTNVSFALDSITREIRTGHAYYCSDNISSPPQTGQQSCTNGGLGIAITRGRDNARIAYRFNQGVAADGAVRGYIEQYEDDRWIPITSVNEIDIDVFVLIARNTSTADAGQPTVDLFIRGTMSNGLDVSTEFTVQSRVVQRRLDII